MGHLDLETVSGGPAHRALDRGPGGAPERKPWLSVIMPTYQSERWIAETLRSLVSQNTDGIELIVIDNSPDDSTLDLIRPFEDQLSLRAFKRCDIPVWHQKSNFGTREARADHVCWLHHDDLWLPNRVAMMRQWIDQAPEVDLHIAPTALIDASSRKVGRWDCPLPSEKVLDPALFVRRLLVQNFISVPCAVYRRDAWLKLGGLDESLWYTADWDFWLKLGANGSVIYHDVETTAFRVHGSSLTATGSRNAAAFEQQMLAVLERHQIADPSTQKMARASIAVNVCLAAVRSGEYDRFPGMIRQLLALGPRGILGYLRYSRILQRVTGRLRANMKEA